MRVANVESTGQRDSVEYHIKASTWKKRRKKQKEKDNRKRAGIIVAVGMVASTQLRETTSY